VTGYLFASFAYSNEPHAGPKDKTREYSTCISEAQAIHPEVVSCMESEIMRRKKNIETNIEAASNDPSLSGLASSFTETDHLWTMYIEKLCDTYNHIEGQRGETLIENCILNEVTHRELFLKKNFGRG
jgi:galactokinase/mevalonate kinase-like predicted kinase